MRNTEELLSHADFLRRLALGLLRGDSAAADDVVQQTYLASLEAATGRPRNTRAWLARVARNFVFRRQRAEGRRRRREWAACLPRTAPATVDAAARLELQRRVVAAVTALEEPYRTTVVLRYFDGLDPGEIARRAGVPKETVRTRLVRALQQLRARLDQEWKGGRTSWSLALAPLVTLAHDTDAAAFGAAAGGIVMSAKTKVALVLLPLIGGAVGVLGHAAYERRAPAPRVNPATGSARIASLEAERDRLRDTVTTLRQENDGLRRELAAARQTQPAPGSRAVADTPPSGDLAGIDWKRYLPVFRGMAAREPESDAREDPALANDRRELVQQLATSLENLPDEFRVDDLWRIPEVGSRIVAVLAADLDPDLPPAAAEAIRTEVETALRQSEGDVPDQALDIERFAAVERATAASEAIVARRATPEAARRATAVFGPLWRRDYWRAMRLGVVDEQGFAEAVGAMHEEVDEQTRAKVREIAARMFKSFLEVRARLVREHGEQTVRAFLLEPGRGGADEAVLEQRRKQEDYPTAAQRLRAEFASHQARYEREFYEALPPSAQQQQRMIAATLFLFDVKR